ncbi:hypothetical protein RYR54_001870 [Aeromonas sobria]|jgi:hypothetical protein|nr:hypothetical protein [Aeromonas sobria]
MIKKSLIAWALSALLLPLVSHAKERNDIPDCYQYAGLTSNKPEFQGRDFIIVVDETTPLPDAQKREALAHVLRFVQPGDKVKQFRFSAFLPDSHLGMEFAGELQSSPEQAVREDIGTNSLKKLDQCLAKQQQFFKVQIAKHMGSSFGDATKDINKSEIVFSLKQIGDAWKHSASAEKVMFIVSDMLENSDYTSFYKNNQIRQIDPSKEMEKVTAANLKASLQDVRVYVAGAGLVPSSSKTGYRSGKTVQLLELFWGDYFNASGASLEAFGAPSLTQDIQ